MQLYNTLTRKKEEFKPIETGKIKMYVCGPTVYDLPHIGHIRSAFIFDVIRRYMEYAGFDVNFVRNVTDIDDKIINRAGSEIKKEGKKISFDLLKQKTQEVSAHYLGVYHEVLDIFGVCSPTREPKATENIREMIEFIKKLIDKEYAYVVGGDVYFSVGKFKGYGKLSKQNRDQMMHGVRVESAKEKQDPLDFALWKEAKTDEPFWESPWGNGRPGWHIECSVMSTNMLGTQFDIHGGGLDLIFPHHENEIAQAEAATGGTFANYWVHNGLLTVNGEKMSKSLGNYITVADFLDKYSDPDILKIAFLNSHYRSPMDYNDEKMKASRSAKERILIFLSKADKLIREADKKGVICAKAEKMSENISKKFNEVMKDDLNTALAMSVIFEAVKTGNESLTDDALKDDERVDIVSVLRDRILKSASVLGLSLDEKVTGGDLPDEIEELIRLREEARKNKNYAASDRMRDELLKNNIVVEDTPEGQVWRRK